MFIVSAIAKTVAKIAFNKAVGTGLGIAVSGIVAAAGVNTINVVSHLATSEIDKKISEQVKDSTANRIQEALKVIRQTSN